LLISPLPFASEAKQFGITASWFLPVRSREMSNGSTSIIPHRRNFIFASASGAQKTGGFLPVNDDRAEAVDGYSSMSCVAS
jgi:hypothetical protein